MNTDVLKSMLWNVYTQIYKLIFVYYSITNIQQSTFDAELNIFGVLKYF